MGDRIERIKAKLEERFGDIGDDIREALDKLRGDDDEATPPASETQQTP